MKPETQAKTWWQRNRLWLLLLVPLLFLALAASSFRLWNLYLPWEWSRPTVANDVTGTLRHSYIELDGQPRTREVQVTVLSAEVLQQHEQVKAVDGGALWRVLLELEAEPDQILQGCQVELVDAQQTRYDYRSGLEPASEDVYWLPPVLVPCVPEDAPGPVVEAFGGELVESPVERPRSWPQGVLIAMPEGVVPTGVRIGWNQPDYLVLEVP